MQNETKTVPDRLAPGDARLRRKYSQKDETSSDA